MIVYLNNTFLVSLLFIYLICISAHYVPRVILGTENIFSDQDRYNPCPPEVYIPVGEAGKKIMFKKIK